MNNIEKLFILGTVDGTIHILPFRDALIDEREILEL